MSFVGSGQYAGSGTAPEMRVQTPLALPFEIAQVHRDDNIFRTYFFTRNADMSDAFYTHDLDTALVLIKSTLGTTPKEYHASP